MSAAPARGVKRLIGTDDDTDGREDTLQASKTDSSGRPLERVCRKLFADDSGENGLTQESSGVFE